MHEAHAQSSQDRIDKPLATDYESQTMDDYESQTMDYNGHQTQT